MTIKLMTGEVVRCLRRLPAESVDAIVTDPPYGQTNESYDSAVAFSADVWRECCRIAKPSAALVSFAGSPTYHRIASAIEAGGWGIRQMWGWVYRDGMITSAWPREGFDRLAPAMDPICYATKGKVLLDLTREGEPWQAWHERKPTDSRYSGRSRFSGVTEASGHWPRSLASDGAEPFRYFALPRTSGRYLSERVGHPNQKPEALIRWILEKLPGDAVLDPFAGAGTVGLVCQQLGRDFIGIDLNPAYVSMARRRIKKAAQARVQVSA